jgi:uncharacterized protein YjiS (DUF1127 family)
MAALDTTRPTATLTAGRMTNMIANMFGAVASWNDARITRKSLSQLSLRELDDIGLSYGDIDTISARSAR